MLSDLLQELTSCEARIQRPHQVDRKTPSHQSACNTALQKQSAGDLEQKQFIAQTLSPNPLSPNQALNLGQRQIIDWRHIEKPRCRSGSRDPGSLPRAQDRCVSVREGGQPRSAPSLQAPDPHRTKVTSSGRLPGHHLVAALLGDRGVFAAAAQVRRTAACE
jgi:hypothetical protein